MFVYFLQLRAAGGHGQRFRADEFAAPHVERRVADDDDLLRLQILAQQPPRPRQRGQGDVIAVLVVVGKAAELKQLPQAEMPQLDFRAELDVAREQAQRGRLRQRLQIAEKLDRKSVV